MAELRSLSSKKMRMSSNKVIWLQNTRKANKLEDFGTQKVEMSEKD